MLQGHPQICLFQPEIPQNTGNIGRLVAGTGARLHLIAPFGFSIDDKNLRRPGLDYWPFLDLEIHDDLESLLASFKGRVAFFSARTTRGYWEVPASTELLVFGQETKGLPAWVHEKYADHMYTIPMLHPKVRSHNIANAVSIVLYDQLLRRGKLKSSF